MDTITYTAFRAHLAEMMDKVNSNREPLLITRQNGSNAILISVEDFNSYEETAYLLNSEANVKRLQESMEELERMEG